MRSKATCGSAARQAHQEQLTWGRGGEGNGKHGDAHDQVQRLAARRAAEERVNEAATTVVEVEFAADGDLHYATSDDVFGLDLASRDRDALLRDVPRAIELLCQENLGVRVVAKPVAEPAASARPAPHDERRVADYSLKKIVAKLGGGNGAV